MSFLNLMGDKLKPKEVNDALSQLSEDIKSLDNKITTSDEASEISYSNTASGLSANNVQSAIDELDGNVDTALSLFAISMVTIGDETIEANNDYEWELSLSKTGYTPIGVLGYEQKGSRYFYLLNMFVDMTNSKLKTAVHCSSNTAHARYDVVILWKKV